MDLFRQISMDGLKLLGSGKSGDVYAFDQGRIVKLYRDGRGEYEVLKEFLAAVLMEQKGMKAMKPYEVVKCGEAFGIIYERLTGISLKDRIYQEPERAGEYGAYCARVMRENHSVLLDEDYGLSVRYEFVRWAESIRIFTPAECSVVKTAIHEIPDRLCLLHMDPTPENLLLLLDGSCAWIDLEACGTGHPAFSIQALYCPDFLGMLPGIAPHDAEILRRFWKSFIQQYFEKAERVRMSGILRGIHFLAHLRFLHDFQAISGDTPLFERQAGFLKQMLFRDIIGGMDFNW